MASVEVINALSQKGNSLVKALSALPEDQWFERKSGLIAPKDLAKTLTAFANAEGGTIAVGIRDGAIDGVTAENENAIRQAAIDFTSPPVRTQVDTYEIDDKTVLIFHVSPGENLHTTQSGDCYLRIGDESRRLSLAEQQELAYDRGTKPFEATPVDLEITDLDSSQLDSYRALIGSSSVEAMLSARDLVDRQGRLTVAALLLFDARPQRELPSAYVRVIRYDQDVRGLGRTMNLVDDVRIEGSIAQQIEQAATEIERLVPTREQLTDSGRFERVPLIPRDAWLEGLVNAVIHRSYSLMGDHVRVEIYSHRIEITSPGRFPGLADPSEPLKINRYARNPRIARVCSDMGITRELGEGVKRIFDEMQRRGLTEPIYRQGPATVSLVLDATKSIDPQILAALTKNARAVLEVLLLEARPLSTGQIAELVSISRPTAKRALEALAENGLVSWQGSSQRDPTATWTLV